MVENDLSVGKYDGVVKLDVVLDQKSKRTYHPGVPSAVLTGREGVLFGRVRRMHRDEVV